MARKYILSALLGLLTIFSTNILSAQEQVFTLEDCIRYAQKHSTRVLQAGTDQRIASANYSEAIGQLLPNLSANTSAYINYGRGIDPKTNTYTNINSFRNNYSLEASLLIFDGLRSIFNVRRERFEKVAGHENQKKIEQEVRMSTIEAYYNLLYTRELCTLAQEHLKNSETLSRQSEKMFELGMKSAQDVSEMKATEANDRLKLVQAKNQCEIAALQLKAAMNFPMDRELMIEEDLESEEIMPTPLQADEVYAIAVLKLPQALITESKLNSSKAAYKSSVGAFFPRINLFAGFNTGFSYYMDGSAYESFREQLINRRGGYVGVSLTFDLFTGLKKSANLKRAKAQLTAEEAKRDETYREIYKDIQEAILNLNASVEEYFAAAESAEHLKKAYEAGIKNYQAGNMSGIELSIAATRAKEAKAEVVRKYTMYRLRKEWLAYYTL